MGRAQVVQAKAAGKEPSVHMNPVLLKPEGNSRSQVILQGQVWDTLQARDYFKRTEGIWNSLDQPVRGYEIHCGQSRFTRIYCQ